MLLRQICESVTVYSFSDYERLVGNTRGFALAKAIKASQPHSGTALGRSVLRIGQLEPEADRVIVISDEQAQDKVTNPFRKTGKKAYMVNVATNKYGVAYGDGWSRVDGWSEAIVDYILAEESGDEDDE